MASGEEEFLVDLESGGTTSEEEGSGDSVSSCRIGRKTMSRGNGTLSYDDGLMIGGSDIESSDGFSNLSNVGFGTVEVSIDKSLVGEEVRDDVRLFEKRNLNESCKKPNFKKASKPPRPPKGPLLSESDLKLVKELSELAARKRMRVERMKALRKVKETTRPTSDSNVTAMVITVIFFIAILYQGVFCGYHGKTELVESPAPATVSEGLFSAQLFNDASVNGMTQQSYPPLDLLEQAYSLSHPQGVGRETG